MVNSINGTLTYKAPGSIGVETGGIEWAVETTATTLASLPATGSELRVYTYLHHTQDSMKLYGFGTKHERSVFLALISVNGVGPSLAKKILSGTTPDRFLAAMENEDIDNLATIPGLGKKTAQKIVLQLRGKLAGDTDSGTAVNQDARDVVEALSAMGFDAKGAGKVVTSILGDPEIESMEGEDREREILRRAIVALST